MCTVTRLLAVVLILLTAAIPAAAQGLPVFDTLNLSKITQIVKQTLEVQKVLAKQLTTLEQMSQRQPGMDRYRTPPILPSQHDVNRFAYAAPLLAALNSGDPRGELYTTVVRALPPLEPAIAHLPPAARRILEQQYAAIEIADAVAQRGIHQRALVGGFAGGPLASAIEALVDDVTNPRTAYHYLTFILDKLTGGELIARRQDEFINQIHSHQLEQQLVRTKRQRDTEAEVMRFRLAMLTLSTTPHPNIITGSAEALQTWRQP